MDRPSLLERLTRWPWNSALGSLARLPLKLIPRDRVMRVRSGLNAGAHWIAGSSVHGCWLGTYEAEEQRLVAKLVKPGMTVWDVGANAGFYTLAFSRLVGPAGRVYAFEPLAENAANLLKHVELNGLRNVVLTQAAVAALVGPTRFEAARSNAMGRLSDGPRSYTVPCTTADAFVEQHPESIPSVIKVDIEGGEGALLEGAGRLLHDCDPELLLSLHGVAQQRRCQDLLESHGYSFFGLDGRSLDGATTHEVHARKVRRRSGS